MKLPRTHRLSFGNKFAGPWGDSNGRDFLFGKDPFNNLWETNKKPIINLKKNHDYCEIEFALSGYNKDQISVHIDDDILIISGKKKKDAYFTSEYIIKEHDVDSFRRSFQLGNATDQNNIDASFKNGILHIKLHHIQGASIKSKRKEIVLS